MQWNINGACPDSGMYILNIPLASIYANNLRGPDLDLAIRFNQFNASDYGFGAGWEINLARIDEDSNPDDTSSPIRTLVLSDGSRYRIITDDSGNIILKYKRTNTFTFTQEANGSYKIRNKNGYIETLSAGKTTCITTPDKKSIYITWNDDNTFKMRDDTGATLLSTRMTQVDNSREHILTSPRGDFSFMLMGPQPCQLRTITAISPNRALLYSFSYLSHNTNYLLIKNWQSLLDYYQECTIEYQQLPAPVGLTSPISAVSAVFLTRTPFATLSKKTVDTRYEYSASNYLGYPDVVTWSTDVDNLENLPITYSYSVIETTGDKDNPLKTTTRTYNKFYLLSTELPQEKSSDRTCFTTFTYSINGQAGIDAQSPSFMLPVRHDMPSITGEGESVHYTNFYNLFEYDQFSNLTRYRSMNGMTEWHAYYPAEGETTADGTVLCPPDPNGFVNFLKSTTCSSKTTPDATPKKRWEYVYEKINNTDLILRKSEQFFLEEKASSSSPVALKKTSYTHDSIGRIKKISTEVASLTRQEGAVVPVYLATTTTFTYVYSAANKTVTAIKETTGYDNPTIKKTESITQHYPTGDITASSDCSNIISTFKYDHLGRTISSTHAKGHPNELTTSITFDALTNRTTAVKTSLPYAEVNTFDGSGNLLSTVWRLQSEASPQEGEQVSYEILRNEYNDLNQLTKETRFDYPCHKKTTKTAVPFITNITTYRWNIYNEILSKSSTDRSQEIYEYDKSSKNRNQKSIAVNFTPGNAKTVTYFNQTGQIERLEKYASSKEKLPDYIETFTYDDFMRQYQCTQTEREGKLFLYDAFDRLITTIGSSSGKTVYSYAPHSSEALVSSISAGNLVIGKSKYDGLNRVISSSTQSTESQYDYTTTSLFIRPNRITIAGGRIWEYEYNAAIGQVTTEKIMDANKQQLALASFSYATSSGLLVQESIVRSDGTHTQNRTYNQFNQLAEETGGWETAKLGKYKTSITPSVCGKPEEISVLFNNGTTTIRAKYKYDSDGKEKFIVYYLSNEKLTDSLICLSHIHRSATTGNIVAIDNYAKFAHNDRYNMIQKKITYGNYNFISGTQYFFYRQKILDVKIKYNKNSQLSNVAYAFQATNAHEWSEFYQYNDCGSLSTWKRAGNVVYHNEFNENVNCQYFKYNTLNDITSIKSETAQKRTESVYTYNNSGLLEKISITEPGTSTNAQAYLRYDAEGNIVRNIYTKGSAVTEKTFSFKEANNVTQITCDGPGENLLSSYFYNASGKKIWVSGLEGGVSMDTATLYAGNCLRIEQQKEKQDEKSAQSYRIFHYVNDETAFTTEVHSDGLLEVRPCLNGPYRTPVVEGHIKAVLHDQVYNYRIDSEYSYYDFRIRGQNPYGMTFDLGSSFYHPGYYYKLPDFS